MTPLCTDVLAYTPPVPFDAMVFCFLGSMEEILAAALRQCRGTVLAVVRDDVCHRFSGAPRAPGRHSFDAACGVLDAHGIPYTAQRAALDFPQPFRTLEDARTFLALYGGGAPAEDDLRAKLISTGRSGLPVAAARCPPLWNNCIFNRRRRTHMNKTKRSLALVLALVMSLTLFGLRPEGPGRQDRRQHPDGGHHPRVHRLLRPRGHRPHRYPEGRRLRPSGPDGGLCHRPGQDGGVANAWDKTAENYFDQKYLDLPLLGQLYGGKGELNLETLLAADPDVVIDVGEPKSTMAEDLDGLQEQTGIPFVHIDAYLASMDDTYAMLSDLLAMPTRVRPWPTTAAMPMTPSRPSWTAWRRPMSCISPVKRA